MLAELAALAAQSAGHRDRIPGKPLAAALADNNAFSYWPNAN